MRRLGIVEAFWSRPWPAFAPIACPRFNDAIVSRASVSAEADAAAALRTTCSISSAGSQEIDAHLE